MFDPPDTYGVRKENTRQSIERANQLIQDAIEQDEIPSKQDVVKFRFGWYDSQCSRKLSHCYFPQVFGYGNENKCVGTGNPDYIIVVAKKYYGQYGGFGTHVFCKSCLDEYIKRTGPYIKSGKVFESPERKVFVYDYKVL